MLSLGYQSGTSVNNIKDQNGSAGYTNYDSPAHHTTSINSINNKNQFNNPNDFITYVIPDFNAVKYFQKEFVQSSEFHIIEESEVTGFEIYLVEQWMYHRNISTVVSAYTGNDFSKISVIKFTIIKKPSKYYPLRFQEYLNEIIQNHSKMKTMDISRINNTESSLNDSNEVCFVTNLTMLPSNLNLIPIPGGDIRMVEKYFIINSNLKRLQCTGRSISLISDKISDASEDKFRQMYRIYNTKIPVKFAIRELINLIQISLFYFDLLDIKYCNGLLCAKTEEAITNWWNLIGLPHFNVKPNLKNGILPSMTVAAIISLILSVRLRIIIVGGTEVPKDPFDFENFMISIGQFQKQSKFDKTRKLDMETLNKLFTITNARLLPEKNSNYFYSDLDQSQDYELVGSPPNSSGSKRSYGKKELKKLTNVVKATVQDHINVSSMDSNKATTGRIRNRIAKLADTISPLDVEALDLDLLVKNYLTGKSLIRLFYGIQSSGLQPQISSDQNRTRRRGKSISEDSQYHFECLRDKITQTSDIKASIGFKKFNKRNNQKSLTHLEPGVNLGDERSNQSSSMVDSFLQLNNETNSGAESIGESIKKCESVTGFQNPLTKFKHELNRRNSWPMIQQNLNTLSLLKDSPFFEFKPSIVKSRSISFSCIESKLLLKPDPTMGTITKFSQKYLENIKTLIEYEHLKNYYINNKKEYSNANLNKLFQSMNLELHKLKNLKTQMDSSKANIIEGGMANEVEYNIKNLTSSIDRLSYETRIIVKRIKELEENFKLFEIKSNDDCQDRLGIIINQVLQSEHFKQIYDINEQKALAFKLTGDENYQFKTENKNQMGIIRWIIIYIYGVLLSVFQFFQFNRSNMNLDRIRHVWVKLDPNKSMIKKAYSYLGREPTKDSIASDI